MNVLVFDIETIPDVELGRRLYSLDGLTDKQVGYVMQTRRREEVGHEFLSLERHRVVAISIAWRSREGFKVSSLGDPGASERELLERFFGAIDQHSPDLVSWNGSGFDLPVLHYRALKAGIEAPRYFETGEEDPSFRFNNYLGRYHSRHTDLMDVLSGYQARARASLEDIAMLLGLPGKLGMSGDQVWDAWLAGDIAGIRAYCETDVVNTYLVFLRFDLLRGRMTPDQYDAEKLRVRETLAAQSQPHFDRFLAAWSGSGS